MIIVIRDELVYPPTWLPSFRDLTLWITVRRKCEVVIESENPDDFYPWLKPVGALDFVEDFVRPESQDGIRADNTFRRGLTIKVNRIVPENVWTILNTLGELLAQPPEIDLRKAIIL